MTYDQNGNTLSDGMNNYVWDARNRLISADNGGASFSYDFMGRRVSKTLLSSTTSFLYDGVNAVQEQLGGLVVANLLTGDIDERFLRTTTNETDNYLIDALGSTVELTGANGAAEEQYSYSPYGSLSATGITTTNSYTYTGRESDGLGIYYYRARYYNPETGRFLSEDPADYKFDLNLYRYAYDEPTDFFDPSGLRGKKPPKPPTPQISPDAAFYICCQNGAFGICDGPKAVPSAFNNPLFNIWHVKCEKEHEQQHLNDLNAGNFPQSNPSSCSGQRNGRRVGIPGNDSASIECPAYQKQLDCLNQQPYLMSSDIQQVKDQLQRRKCKCGK
jgi:RHS repeat-associated protein